MIEQTSLNRVSVPYPLSVKRISTARLPTKWGEFNITGYQSLTSREEFVALYVGEMRSDIYTFARIQSQCITGEIFGSLRCDCGVQLQHAMEIITREGRGVIVYQLQEGRGIGIINKIRAYALQDGGADTVEANELLGLAIDLREYKQCAEILIELGLSRIRLLSNNPLKIRALEESGLEVVERIAIEVNAGVNALPYLLTKKRKMGHLLTSI